MKQSTFHSIHSKLAIELQSKYDRLFSTRNAGRVEGIEQSLETALKATTESSNFIASWRCQLPFRDTPIEETVTTAGDRCSCLRPASLSYMPRG